MRPVKLYTSFDFWDDLISIKAQIFLRLVSMLLWLTKYLINFLGATSTLI